MKKTFIQFRLLHYLLFILLASCKPQTPREQMLATSHKIVNVLKTGTEKDFMRFIAVELDVLSKDEESIKFDFSKLKKYHKEYLNFSEPKYVVIEESNSLSQKIVQIIFHKGVPKSTVDYDIRLDLEFGPPQLFSLNKISGYQIVDKLDALYPSDSH